MEEQTLIPGIGIGSANDKWIHLSQEGDIIAIRKDNLPEFLRALGEYVDSPNPE